MFIEDTPIISTHNHLVYDSFYVDVDLAKLFSVSYPGGWQIGFRATESTDRVFDLMAHNNSFLYLCRAMGDLYNGGQPLTTENRDRVEEAMQAAYAADPMCHHSILTQTCRMKWVLLDEHRDPGDDHGRAYLRPAVRFTDFMLGKGLTPDTPFSDYLDDMERLLDAHPRAVALKLSSAYDRDLCFEDVDRDAVRAERDRGQFGRACQNAVFDRICRLAEERDLPFQIHTGMGCLDGTRAIGLLPVIRSHPRTRFALLHVSFPWTDDVLALGRDLPNVYVDLAWLPTLSVTRCARFIREAVETLDAARLMWGDDCWTAEESYASLLALDDALAMALGHRSDARAVAERILFKNADALYALS